MGAGLSRDRSCFINGDFKHHGSVKIRHQAEKGLVKVENQISYLVKARLAGFVLQAEEIRSTLSMLCVLRSSRAQSRRIRRRKKPFLALEEYVSGTIFLITAQPTKANPAKRSLH